MTLLTALGLASVVFVAVFTVRAYHDNTASGGQSRRSAIVEAWANILIGFAVNYATNLLVLPLVGAHVSLLDNFMLGWVFTTMSIVRQYALRRWFNTRIHALAARIDATRT